jgi:hypothetical protein
MEESNYSRLLRNLANDYYHNYVDLADYRAQRKKVLDRIDMEMNGKAPAPEADEDGDDDATFLQTQSFMNDQDLDP